MMTKGLLYLGAVGVLLIGVFLYGQHQRAQGAAEVRAQIIKEAIESVKKMEKDNVEIKKLDDPAICHEFGYEWVPEQGGCG
jgi:hypothetical protein